MELVASNTSTNTNYAVAVACTGSDGYSATKNLYLNPQVRGQTVPINLLVFFVDTDAGGTPATPQSNTWTISASVPNLGSDTIQVSEVEVVAMEIKR